MEALSAYIFFSSSAFQSVPTHTFFFYVSLVPSCSYLLPSCAVLSSTDSFSGSQMHRGATCFLFLLFHVLTYSITVITCFRLLSHLLLTSLLLKFLVTALLVFFLNVSWFISVLFHVFVISTLPFFRQVLLPCTLLSLEKHHKSMLYTLEPKGCRHLIITIIQSPPKLLERKN